MLPLGGDSEPGSESDDETRLREAGAMTLLDGTGKFWNDSGKLNLKENSCIIMNRGSILSCVVVFNLRLHPIR